MRWLVLVASARGFAPSRREALGGLLSLAAPSESAVEVLSNGRSQVALVGTAHISRVSVQEVADTMTAVKPELVVLELDSKRVKGASQRPQQSMVGDLIKTMYASLDKLGYDSGQEFAVAVDYANRNAVPVLLADQDVDITLKRLTQALKATKFEELKSLDAAIGDFAGVDLETIKTRANVRRLVAALRDNVPDLYAALIDERDAAMASNILRRLVDSKQPPRRVVAVVGMAHEDGIARRLIDAGFRANRLKL